MSYLQYHLELILADYSGSLPLHHFLKNYFRLHPKLGSRDRRGLSDAAYAWYRVGKALQHTPCSEEAKRMAALQLCGLRPKAWEPYFLEEWKQNAGNLPGKLPILWDEIFPFDIPFSEGINRNEWLDAMKRQPQLFLRIRGNQKAFSDILEEKGIAFEWLRNDCLALPNGTKVETLFPADSYVVQDASSQATAAYFMGSHQEHWWDCCAGAGGKSLMLAEQSKSISLLVTDRRPSILSNLKERFQRYQLALPESRCLDVSDARAVSSALGKRQFEGIICDAPCSGSGTWARTPEHCYFFRPELLKNFCERQQNILRNASGYLAPGGRILYITCSIFHCENEAVAEQIAGEAGLRIESMQLINGLPLHADSLFVAVLRNS
ncbi:MAG: hypothetical protein JST06_11080 [Bacteroidetes bacterium]|nr:hypothetical protein [Bacteroidota bacterium]MBS1630368.1 hypothetical protein [Bacteroidota bacterium]